LSDKIEGFSGSFIPYFLVWGSLAVRIYQEGKMQGSELITTPLFMA